MRRTWLLLLAGLLAEPAVAQPLAAPAVKPGDAWVYSETSDGRDGWRQIRVERVVLRAGPSGIVTSNRPVGSSQPPTERLAGADWSLFRSVNGRETVVNRPLVFPLAPGKTWEVEVTEEQPNRQLGRRHIRHAYRAVGWEEVTVPAGTFRALKIEAEGQWTTTTAPATVAATGTRLDAQGARTVMQTGPVRAATSTGRAYKAFWYVPAVRRWVRAVEESYDSSGGKDDRLTVELESYRLAD